LKPDLIILPPNNAPIIIGELTSPTLLKMRDCNQKKEKKYTDHLVPNLNRPASVLAFEVGDLGETTNSLYAFLISLGLRKKFCVKLKKEVSAIAAEC